MNDKESRAASADGTVKKHMWAASAIGFLPFPWVDMAALAALQLNLLHGLATLYDVEFSAELGKSLIAALSVGGGAASVSATGRSLLKIIPFSGLVGGLGSAALFGASTYALGKVFVQHFESGGSLLNFDPRRAREYYAKQYAEGQKEIAKSKKPFVGIQP
jgi:uncharacterized protein (DUF697 family)